MNERNAPENDEMLPDADDLLCEAVLTGSVADVEKQLKKGTDPNGYADIFCGATYVYAAAERGNCEILKLLIDYGANISKPTQNTNTTPLEFARVAGKDEIVKILEHAARSENIDEQ